MFCNKCGKQVNDNARFCPNCGNVLGNNQMNQNMVNNGYGQMYNNQYNYPYQVNNQNKNNKKIPIICMGIAIVLLVVGIILLTQNNGNGSRVLDENAKERTVLIYLCGANLESKNGIATSEIEALLDSDIDIENMNVLIYTGGSKKWYTDIISSDENAIYLLKSDSLEKVKSYQASDMGDKNTFLEFLDYSWENYPSKKYDLIMWNHGLGMLGVASDEKFFEDYLNLDEIKTALEKSKFNGNDKFETVVFRSCLNATLEVASVFVPYANYMVASEEITYGLYGGNTLSFLSNINPDDNGINFGKAFINSYEESLKYIASRNYSTIDEVFEVRTYSIIDLSRVNSLIKSLNMFVKNISLDKNYNMISRVRSNLYQYGSTSTGDYDTVDLFTLINELETLSPNTAGVLKDNLNNTIVYNWTNTNFSKGLSVYFPYNGGASVLSMHSNIYKKLSDFSDYYSFINKFASIKSSSSSGGFSIVAQNEINVNINNKKVTLEIDNDDVDNYAKASYMIFKKNNDGTFMSVYESDTFELAKDKYEITLDNPLVKIVNNENKKSKLINITKTPNGDNIYMTKAKVSDDEDDIDINIYLKVDDKVSITKTMMINTEVINGSILDITNYSSVEFINNNYNILTNNKMNDGWDMNGISSNVKLNSYSFEKVELDNTYYVSFKIYDVDNNYTYSNLINIK